MSLRDRILEQVLRVPKGRVATYGEIAALAGAPRAARQVGWALASLPDGSNIPWWRIVNRRGQISCRTHGAELQENLLRAEGIAFSPEGAIDLGRYGWTPEPD